MDGDVSPELSEESNDNDVGGPTGDLADLTASVTDNAATGGAEGNAQLPQSTARTTAYKGRGKGVGKGKSGSSGPPVKRRRPSATVSRAPQEEDHDDTSEDDGGKEMATQSITVRLRRGYTSYPAYMFDIPPRKLKTDNLRKKLMISEIKNSKAQEEFFKRGIEMMGVMKEFFRMYAQVHQFPGPLENVQGEHGYAMTQQSDHDNTNNDDGDADGAQM